MFPHYAAGPLANQIDALYWRERKPEVNMGANGSEETAWNIKAHG